MEITESTVYWVTRLDGIHNFLSILCIITGVPAVFSLVTFATFMVSEGEEEFHPAMKFKLRTFFISIALLAVFFLVSVFVPTTKEMAIIKVLPAISNSKFISDDLPKEAKEIYMLAKEALKKKLKEGTEANDKL